MNNSIWQSRYLHCFLFGLFPILFLYSENSSDIKFSEILIPIALIVFAIAAILFIFTRLTNLASAGVATSAMIIHLFAFGQLVVLFEISNFIPDNIGPIPVALAVWLISFLITESVILKKQGQWRKLRAFFNVLAMILVSVQIFGAVYNSTSTNFSQTDMIASTNVPVDTVDPDIYYIILDGYGRSDVLKEIYNYDNRTMIDGLRDLGFYVADDSRSNYGATDQSLTSALNMDYLHNLAKVDPNETERTILAEMFTNNKVTQFLRERNYEIVSFTTGFTLTEIARADQSLSVGVSFSNFQSSLLGMTPIAYISPIGKNQFERHRDQVNFALHKVAELESSSRPRFVFDHIVCPHPPFVFGPSGEEVENSAYFSFSDGSHFFEKGNTKIEYVNGYRDQVEFVSQEIVRTVKGILRDSKRPTVIMIQGDHGPGLGLNWQNAGKSDLWERFSILNAYYFPDQQYTTLSSDITPVNSFRVLLNKFFNTKLDLLPNRNIFTARSKPYLFIDVTKYISR